MAFELYNVGYEGPVMCWKEHHSLTPLKPKPHLWQTSPAELQPCHPIASSSCSPNTSYLDNFDCFLMTVHALLLSHIQFILRTTIHPLKFLLLPYCFLVPNIPSFSTVYRIKFKILSLSQRIFYTDCESCLLIQEEILSVSYPAAGTLWDELSPLSL